MHSVKWKYALIIAATKQWGNVGNNWILRMWQNGDRAENLSPLGCVMYCVVVFPSCFKYNFNITIEAGDKGCRFAAVMRGANKDCGLILGKGDA